MTTAKDLGPEVQVRLKVSFLTYPTCLASPHHVRSVGFIFQP